MESGQSVGTAAVYEGEGSKPSAQFFDETSTLQLYGAAAALSADGTLAVIGAPGSKANETGYVLGYLRGSEGWVSESEWYPLWFRFPAMDIGWF